MAKDVLPRPPGIQRNPQKANRVFFPVESRAPMLRHANPGCWGSVREVAGLHVTLGNYTVNGAALMRK